MRNILKKLTLCALILGILGASMSFTACGGESWNRAKLLYVGNYYGGLGDAWLKECIADYTELHPDIKIEIDNDKPNYLRDALPSRISGARQDLYFVDKTLYHELAVTGKILDITDAVTTPLTEYGESKSIIDKMYPENDAFFNIDGKYYALPTYISRDGIVYDVDLFYNYLLFFGEDGNFITSKTATKSVGQDGIPNTWDDGLPSTIEDFSRLMSRMRSNSITPFTWAGEYPAYTQAMLTGVWANYEGAENFAVNNTFDGYYTFAGDSQPTKIDNSNAYMLQKQEGKRYALRFAREILSNNRNYTLNAVSSQSHLDAQTEFLLSNSPEVNKPIAMLFEGDWWVNEAKQTFNDMRIYGEDFYEENRRFSFMPFPRAEGAPGEGSSVVFSFSGTAAFFINAKTPNAELAKDFLRFCHTENSLRVFTKHTGAVKPFDYDLSPEEYAGLSYFAKLNYDYYRDTDKLNVKIVYDQQVNDMIKANRSYFNEWAWASTVNRLSYTSPFDAFVNAPSMTADDYFNGLYLQYQPTWNDRFKNWF